MGRGAVRVLSEYCPSAEPSAERGAAAELYARRSHLSASNLNSALNAVKSERTRERDGIGKVTRDTAYATVYDMNRRRRAPRPSLGIRIKPYHLTYTRCTGRGIRYGIRGCRCSFAPTVYSCIILCDGARLTNTRLEPRSEHGHPPLGRRACLALDVRCCLAHSLHSASSSSITCSKGSRGNGPRAIHATQATRKCCRITRRAANPHRK